MARIPENINFCQFAECHYLQGEECTAGECVFNEKWRKWWEWSKIHGRPVQSFPSLGGKQIQNIYPDDETKEIVFET